MSSSNQDVSRFDLGTFSVNRLGFGAMQLVAAKDASGAPDQTHYRSAPSAIQKR